MNASRLASKIVHNAATIVSSLLVLSLFEAKAAKALAVLNINGIETTAFKATGIEFNLTLFQFGGATAPNQDIIKFNPSGDEELFNLLVTGDAIKNNYEGLKVTGIFGSKKLQGGELLLDVPWWKYNFTFNLYDSFGRICRLTQDCDKVSAANGSVQHIIGPHEGDNELGVDLVWGDLNLSANAADAVNGVQKVSLDSYPCTPHPGNKPPHKDCVTKGILSANIEDGLIVDSISSWRLEVGAQHQEEVPGPVPIAGGAVAFSYSRKLRRLLKGTSKYSGFSATRN
jgi:hypothetical protein